MRFPGRPLSRRLRPPFPGLACTSELRPLVARSVGWLLRSERPESGVKPTCLGRGLIDAIDPKRTFSFAASGCRNLHLKDAAHRSSVRRRPLRRARVLVASHVVAPLLRTQSLFLHSQNRQSGEIG
jgi:hypothetical protein